MSDYVWSRYSGCDNDGPLHEGHQYEHIWLCPDCDGGMEVPEVARWEWLETISDYKARERDLTCSLCEMDARDQT